MTIARRVTVREVDGRGAEFVIDVAEDDTIHVDPGGKYTASRVDEHAYRVTATDRSTHVIALQDGDIVWLFADGVTWRVRVNPGQSTPPTRRAPVDASLSAPMPATVAHVPVEVGEAVSQGETLIVLEAMKMELSIRAPRAGRVTAIHCQVGELVQPGVPLLSLE